MRGADAPPGSKATSRANGSRRNLGDLARPAVASAIPGHVGKSRRRSRRGTGERNPPVIPANLSLLFRLDRTASLPNMRSALPRIENFDTDTADNRDKRKTLRQARHARSRDGGDRGKMRQRQHALNGLHKSTRVSRAILRSRRRVGAGAARGRVTARRSAEQLDLRRPPDVRDSEPCTTRLALPSVPFGPA